MSKKLILAAATLMALGGSAFATPGWLITGGPKGIVAAPSAHAPTGMTAAPDAPALQPRAYAPMPVRGGPKHTI